MNNSPPPNLAGSNTQATTPNQHALYYLKDDPMAIFLVEGQLFKIHRHFLSGGSEVFRDMFTCPVGEGTGPEGMTNERPIHLPGVTVKEFEVLLDYFYRSPHLKPECSKEQRLQISLDLLSISHRLDFDEIFKYVLGDLKSIIEDIPAIEIFFIGQKYDLEEWLLSAYEAFLDRATPLTVHDVEVLGPDKVVRYMRASKSREACLREDLNRQRTEARWWAGQYKKGQVPFVTELNTFLSRLPPVTAPRSTRDLVKEFFLE